MSLDLAIILSLLTHRVHKPLCFFTQRMIWGCFVSMIPKISTSIADIVRLFHTNEAQNSYSASTSFENEQFATHNA